MLRVRDGIELMVTFGKIGIFTFGGGMALIPFFEDEFVNKKHWVSAEEMPEIIALSQSFPGVISVNISIMVGHRIAGLFGAICAVLGTVVPALVGIILLLTILRGFEDNFFVRAIFVGIRAASAALIFNTVLRMARRTLLTKFDIMVGVIALALILFGFSCVWSVLVGAIAGVFYSFKIAKK